MQTDAVGRRRDIATFPGSGDAPLGGDAGGQGHWLPLPVLGDAPRANCSGRRGVRRDYTSAQGTHFDPLYLLACGARWHRQGEASAGWELVQCLRSWDSNTRAIAADLLAKTENARLLVKELRRARGRLRRPVEHVAEPNGSSAGKVVAMNTPLWVGIDRELSHLQVAEGSLVLRPLSRRTQPSWQRQPLEHLPRRGPFVCRRTDAAGGICALLGPGQTLDYFAGRQSTDFENRRGGRGAGLECRDRGRTL